MTHTGYTIQMKIKNIKVHLLNGAQTEGQVFVSEYSPLHAGDEKISEYFEQNSSFLPFKTGTDLILLSKNFIVFAEYQSEEDYSIYNKVETEITLFGGKTFSVFIPIFVPNPGARLSDQINQTEKFLLCSDESGGVTYLFNKNHIVSLKEKR